MLKRILLAIWTFSLEKTWNLMLSKTTIDEKTIEVIDEIHVRSRLLQKELNDVADVIKNTPVKPKKRYYKPKAKTDIKK